MICILREACRRFDAKKSANWLLARSLMLGLSFLSFQRFIRSSDRLEQELRDRCNSEKLVTVADLKRHPRQNCGNAKDLFDDS